jgi:hypothetical protein
MSKKVVQLELREVNGQMKLELKSNADFHQTLFMLTDGIRALGRNVQATPQSPLVMPDLGSIEGIGRG